MSRDGHYGLQFLLWPECEYLTISSASDAPINSSLEWREDKVGISILDVCPSLREELLVIRDTRDEVVQRLQTLLRAESSKDLARLSFEVRRRLDVRSNSFNCFTLPLTSVRRAKSSGDRLAGCPLATRTSYCTARSEHAMLVQI
eukprot:7149015-Prymnesium_polylepis.2